MKKDRTSQARLSGVDPPVSLLGLPLITVSGRGLRSLIFPIPIPNLR